MPIIKEVMLKPEFEPLLPTENKEGLRFAVVYREKEVIALFDCRFWAENFIGGENSGMGFTIREVAE